MVDSVGAVAGTDALDERFVVIASLSLMTEHLVEASLIEGYRISGSEYAHVLQQRRCRIAIAVAVNAHIVHHVDVQDVLSVSKILMDSLCSGGHGLEEGILRLSVLPAFRGVVGDTMTVDVSLACSRGDADASVLEHATETAHGVSFEMSQVDHEVIGT